MTYGIWIATGSRDAQVLAFALRGVKFIDDRIANPAYGLLLLTGVAMVLVGGIPITTPWLLIALVLYVVSILVALFGYTPTLKKQIQLLDRDGLTSGTYKAAATKGGVLGIVLGVIVVAIIFFMVVKPTLGA